MPAKDTVATYDRGQRPCELSNDPLIRLAQVPLAAWNDAQSPRTKLG